MNPTYSMVFINLICSALVFFGAIFYKFIYPKKNINLFVLLLIISFLPIISVFRAGDYESGDFNIHIYRMMSFYNSLKEGILMPSWAGNLNATYGDPLFLFNYSLPYYIISFLHFLGISFITATKLYLGLSLYLSAICMYFFAKEILKSKLAAFSSAIFYLFAPYHLIDVHFRATLGESTIFLIIPLLFLFSAKYIKTNKLFYLALISLLTFGLFLAHPLLALVVIGPLILYITYQQLINKNLKSLAVQLCFVIIGIVASGYTFAPFIVYSKYMFHYPLNGPISFYPFNLLFYSPWRFGFLFQGPKGELATIIGYTQLFIVFTSIILSFRKRFSKKINNQIKFWIILFIATLFMMSPLSNSIWKHSQSIGPMLVSYSRLSLILAFFTSVIAGYFVLHFKNRKRLIYFLLILTVGYTMLNWGHRRVIPQIRDNTLSKNVPYSTLSEGPVQFLDTIWADPKNPWFSEIPKSHLEIIKGQGNVKEVFRGSITHKYIINANTDLVLKENTLYFPGWTASSNGKNININLDKRGVINLKLNAGNHNLTLNYKDIQPILYLKDLTILIVLLLIISGGYSLFKDFPKN